jgi:chorismate dehydratase
MKKPKISIVNYTNTLPFLFGLNQHFSSEEIEIVSDHPADCAKKLLSGETDIGLIPVAILKSISNYSIVSDFCIGSENKVDSVMLYSEVPLHEISTILLDYQSRTSVALVQILCKEHWKINPNYVNAQAGFEDEIQGKIAGVIIGDRTFQLKNKYPYTFDLAENWKELTGLPFVFACWVCTSPLPESFLVKFNAALENGILRTEEAVENENKLNLTKEDCLFYLTQRINYSFNEEKKTALDLFLEKLSK